MSVPNKRVIDFRYAPSIVQTCIGFVDDPHKTIVQEDGSLNYNYEYGPHKEYDPDELGKSIINSPYAEFPLSSFRHSLKPTFTHRDEFIEQTQCYGDPRSAIVTTTEEYEETTFSWTAFAHQTDQGLRADVILWTLEVSDEFGTVPTTVRLDLQGTAVDAPKIHKSEKCAEEWLDERNLPDYAIRRGLNHYRYISSGDTLKGAFAVILEGDLDPEEFAVEWAEEALTQTKSYWRDLQPFQNTFQIPEQQIEAMLHSCGRNILQAREEHDGVTEFQVGPTEYRGLWMVDGHFILEAAHMMGREEEAFEQGILALLRRIKPSGAIYEDPRHMKETGIALATIVRQCELMDDDDRLRELWPTMVRAREYIEHLRAEAEAMGPEYKASDLFPPSFLDGGIAGPYPEYTTPLWMLVGLQSAARAGRRLNLEESERFEELFWEIMRGFERCAERDMTETDSGISYLPMNMEMTAYENPQSSTWALAHAIYPGEVFDPNDDIVENFLELLASIDDEQGLPKETGWIHDEAVWAYSGAFYAQAWLYAGYPEKAIDYLYAFANHAAPNWTWREEQGFGHSNEFYGDMPHNWASAEFIRLVRNLLVFEINDDLELFRGLPEEWLPEADDPLVLEATPTRYGNVDLELTMNDDGVYQVTFERQGGSQEPERIILHWSGEVRDESRPVESTDDGRWIIPANYQSFSAKLI